MPTPNTPLVNGNRHDFSSVAVSLRGRTYNAFKSINYKYTHERGKVRVNGWPAPIGKTRGEYTAEGSLEMLRDEYQDFVDFLMQGQPRFTGIGDIDFQIDVRFVTVGSPRVFQDTLYGTSLKTGDFANQQGSDPSMVKCDLDILYLDINGMKSVGDIKVVAF